MTFSPIPALAAAAQISTTKLGPLHLTQQKGTPSAILSRSANVDFCGGGRATIPAPSANVASLNAASAGERFPYQRKENYHEKPSVGGTREQIKYDDLYDQLARPAAGSVTGGGDSAPAPSDGPTSRIGVLAKPILSARDAGPSEGRQ